MPTKLDQTVRLHLQLCTHTHTLATQAEGRRRAHRQLGTVNSQFFKKFIFCNTLLTVFRIESRLYQVACAPRQVFFV